MTRNEIFDVVKTHMIEIIDEIDESTPISENNRMADLGADSIDVVEVVSDAMRTLKVKVDRTKLDSAQNLSGLLDLLEEAVAAKHGTAPSHSRNVDTMSEAALDRIIQGG